jgi:hypothetical protein
MDMGATALPVLCCLLAAVLLQFGHSSGNAPERPAQDQAVLERWEALKRTCVEAAEKVRQADQDLKTIEGTCPQGEKDDAPERQFIGEIA